MTYHPIVAAHKPTISISIGNNSGWECGNTPFYTVHQKVYYSHNTVYCL